jgi:hypothetical protein
MHDPVNSPSHYTDGTGIECIEAIEASMTTEEFKGFLRGNCQKYLWRYTKKNGAEDLKKAKWYLDRLIAIREMEEAMEKAMEEKTKKTLGISYDPDDYMASGCPDGFCPMPGVRQGPPEELFKPV